MLQKKLSKLKKLSKKQKVILSSVIVVFSCLGATVMSQANSVSVEVMSCEVQQTNVDIPMATNEGEIPYVVWVEDTQETTQSTESDSIAYIWTAEILSDIQIADLLAGITKKHELMDATYFADDNEKNKFCQSLANSENIEFVFVKGENMVMALGDAKLYVQATSIKLETDNDAKFTKGFYKINENYVDVNNSTTIVDEATSQDTNYTTEDTEYTTQDLTIQDATVETTPVQDGTTEVKTGTGEQSQTGQQTTTNSTTTTSTTTSTTTDSDEIPLDSSLEARKIRQEQEAKDKAETPLDSSIEARKIRQQNEEKNKAETPLDSSTEARKIRQENEKKTTSSTKTSTSTSDEIPLDSSTQARKIRQENANKTKTTSNNDIKDAEVVVETKTSSTSTKTTNTPAATTPETRAKVRQERVENIKKESQKVSTKVKEAVPVAKEKAKSWGKKAYDFVMHGPF